jgi:hypothetical protein
MVHELDLGDIVPRQLGDHDLTSGVADWEQYDFVMNLWKPALWLYGRASPSWFIRAEDDTRPIQDVLAVEPTAIVFTYKGEHEWVAALRPHPSSRG